MTILVHRPLQPMISHDLHTLGERKSHCLHEEIPGNPVNACSTIHNCLYQILSGYHCHHEYFDPPTGSIKYGAVSGDAGNQLNKTS